MKYSSFVLLLKIRTWFKQNNQTTTTKLHAIIELKHEKSHVISDITLRSVRIKLKIKFVIKIAETKHEMKIIYPLMYNVPQLKTD